MENDPQQTALAASTGAPEREPADLLAELGRLEVELAEREIALAIRRKALHAFERRYFAELRPLHREIDRVEAEIAEALSALDPDNETLRAQAREARERADAHEETGEWTPDLGGSGCGVPSVGLKRLFREIALETHPDRGVAEGDDELRHELMVEANRAYREGDRQMLEALLAEVKSGAADCRDLQRAARRVAYLKRRLATVEREARELDASRICEEWRAAEAAAHQGRDWISDKVAELERTLKRARARLEVLRDE